MTGVEKLKEAWNENPLGVAIVAAGLLTAMGKLIDSVASIQSKRAYAHNRRKK